MITIGTKLGSGIGILLLLCIIIGLVSYTQTREVREKLGEVTQVKEPLNSAVYGLENNVVETAFAALGHSATGDKKFREALEWSTRRFEENRGRYIEVMGLSQQARPGAALLDGLVRFHSMAAEHVHLKDRLTARMDTLLGTMETLERLLTDRIQASVTVNDPIAYRRLQVVLEMQIQVNAITKSLGNYLLTSDTAFVSRIQTAEAKFKHFADVYQVVLLSREEKIWAAELRRRSLEVPALVGIVIDLQQQRTALLTKFFTLYRDLGVIINEGLRTETERGLASAKADVLEAGEAANARILAVLLLSVLFGVVAGVVTTRSITRPLRHMVSVMDAVARGDRLRKVELTSNDEFRSLGDAFNNMTGQLAEAERQRLDGLRIFATSVQRAQEEERARISRELHDDLCQRLSGMKFRVEALEDDVLPAGRQMSRHLHEVTQELDRSIAEVRRISSNLRPSVLDDFGVVAALRLLCKDFEKRQGIAAALHVDPAVPGQIDGHIEIAMYRIAQEALANIAKHAGATAVSVLLDSPGTCLRLVVQDDGKGFSPEDVTRARGAGHGSGLISMRERSELLGGSLDVRTTADGGTAISVSIPFGEQEHYGEDQNSHR
jgi:signal transduction histidine kinase